MSYTQTQPAGLKIEKLMTFGHDLAYEQHPAGPAKG
jgi:hypothetical protein